jgi:hypothetical protein
MATRNQPSRLAARFFGKVYFALSILALAWNTAALETDGADNCVSYTNQVVPSVPLSINVVTIDRSCPNVRFCTTLGGGATMGMGIVSDQVKTLPAGAGSPLAAINGDFYDKVKVYPGRPRDLQIRNGEVLTQPTGHTCFWIDKNGNPQMTNIFSRFRVIWPDGQTTPFEMNTDRTNGMAVLYTDVLGPSTLTKSGLEYVLEQSPGHDWLPLHAGRIYTAKVRRISPAGNTPLEPRTAVLSISPDLLVNIPTVKLGDTLQLSTETTPNLSGVDVAIGGGPSLVENGQVMTWKGWIHLPAPRTALGWNKHYIFLVEVDGRQLDLSLGMTFTQLAKFMHDLGCEQAMNLDGGGSATLWAFGSVRNSPSEGQERPASNALVVVKRHTATAPATRK